MALDKEEEREKQRSDVKISDDIVLKLTPFTNEKQNKGRAHIILHSFCARVLENLSSLKIISFFFIKYGKLFIHIFNPYLITSPKETLIDPEVNSAQTNLSSNALKL